VVFAKRQLLKWSIVTAALAIFLAAHPVWLGALGSFLVSAEEPVRADLAVVLGGDGYGNRILKAAELVREGFVPGALVSGPAGLYGLHECDLAIPFAVKKGYPESWFIRFPIVAHSTKEEAAAIIPELRRRGVREFLLVTSDYHTRRAAAIYRSLAPDHEMRAIAAPDEFFRADSWWYTRQGRKQFLLEWLKTIAGWLGL
jgi:uncharacterized SAM-binding protein YcdF (DUF218 family)